MLSAAAYVAPVRPARLKKCDRWEPHWDMATKRLRDQRIAAARRLAAARDAGLDTASLVSEYRQLQKAVRRSSHRAYDAWNEARNKRLRDYASTGSGEVQGFLGCGSTQDEGGYVSDHRTRVAK